ncbi:Ku protein [Streptomyces sp. NPDC047022]|uniref:Ku protein n=1 Tax=Streptomyces sp. NPDC047022 TaxID=3155737 RepID=UPI0033DBC973
MAAKPYKLLQRALGRSSRVAVARYSWSGRERLGLLRVRGEAIVLHAMRWPDEVRSSEVLSLPPVEVTDDEIDDALALVDRMTREDLEGPEFVDHYTEALTQIIEAKREGMPLPRQPEQAKPTAVVDLMAALNESLQQAKSARGEDAEIHDLPPKKRVAKKTSAQKPRTA